MKQTTNTSIVPSTATAIHKQCPLYSFFPSGGHKNTMRLNFSNMPPERIVEGVSRLAGVVRQEPSNALQNRKVNQHDK